MNSHYEAHGDEMPKVHKSGTNVGWGHGRYPNVTLPLPPIPVLAEAVATCFLATTLAIPARKTSLKSFSRRFGDSVIVASVLMNR